MDKNDEIEDKPIDWAVLVGAIAFICLGLAAPVVLYSFGGMHINEWHIDSWQPYVAILCLVVYFAIGKVAVDIRKDDDET